MMVQRETLRMKQGDFDKRIKIKTTLIVRIMIRIKIIIRLIISPKKNSDKSRLFKEEIKFCGQMRHRSNTIMVLSAINFFYIFI